MRDTRARPRKLPTGRTPRAIRGRAAAFLLRSGLSEGQRKTAASELRRLGAHKSDNWRLWHLPQHLLSLADWQTEIVCSGLWQLGELVHSEGDIVNVGIGAGADCVMARRKSARKELVREVLHQSDLDACAAHFGIAPAPRCEVLSTLPRDQVRIWVGLLGQWRLQRDETRFLAVVDSAQHIGQQTSAEALAALPLRPKTLSAQRKPALAQNAYGIRTVEPITPRELTAQSARAWWDFWFPMV